VGHAVYGGTEEDHSVFVADTRSQFDMTTFQMWIKHVTNSIHRPQY
jgi:hypothetical protein